MSGRLLGISAPRLARRVPRERPFTVTEVADFDTPWAMDFLPGSGFAANMALVTERDGKLWLVDAATARRSRSTACPRSSCGAGRPRRCRRRSRFRREPADLSELRRSRAQAAPAALRSAMARSRTRGGRVALEDFKIIWRQQPKVQRRRPFLAPHRLRARRLSLFDLGRAPEFRPRAGPSPAISARCCG